MDFFKILIIAYRISSDAGMAVEITVPEIQQKEDFTCGPAALSAAFRRFGINVSEEEITEKAHTSEEVGAEGEDLVAVARSYGLGAELRYNMTADDVAECIQNGQICIICVQSYSDEGPTHDYSEDLDYGHYVVPAKIQNGWMTIMDPWLEEGTQAAVNLGNLRERWHSADSSGKEQSGIGIVISGKPVPIPDEKEKVILLE